MRRQPIPRAAIESVVNSERQAEWVGDLAAMAGHGALAPSTAARLLEAAALVARDLALRDLVELIDPDGTRSRWALACDVESRLAAFERTGWPRWRYSDRQPPDRVDRLLLSILRADPPRSARRLVDLL